MRDPARSDTRGLPSITVDLGNEWVTDSRPSTVAGTPTLRRASSSSAAWPTTPKSAPSNNSASPSRSRSEFATTTSRSLVALTPDVASVARACQCRARSRRSGPARKRRTRACSGIPTGLCVGVATEPVGVAGMPASARGRRKWPGRHASASPPSLRPGLRQREPQARQARAPAPASDETADERSADDPCRRRAADARERPGRTDRSRQRPPGACARGRYSTCSSARAGPRGRVICSSCGSN
jgi:hypothetical protein